MTKWLVINLYTVVKHIRWEISNIFISFLFCKSLSWSLPIIIHPVQVPRWDMPRWLTRSIILLNLPPRSQIIVPRPISKKIFYSAHKETLSPVIYGKLLVITEFEYFYEGPTISHKNNETCTPCPFIRC